MKKFSAILLIIMFSVILASTYGLVHDQITYSISPEYYTKYKFIQFRLEGSPLPERYLVSIVGIGATWWVGLFIGIVFGLSSLIQNSIKNMLKIAFESVCIVIIVAALMGMVGAYVSNGGTEKLAFIYPEVKDLKDFARVGRIHNFSYIGGIVGMLIGIGWQFIRRRKLR